MVHLPDIGDFLTVHFLSNQIKEAYGQSCKALLEEMTKKTASYNRVPAEESKKKQRTRYDSQREPATRAAETTPTDLANQELEIRKGILDTIIKHRDELNRAMENGESCVPGPGTVIRGNVFLTTPLVCELYRSLKEEYEAYGVDMKPHANDKILVFDYHF